MYGISNTNPRVLFEILAVAEEVLEEDHPENTRIRKLAEYVKESLGPLMAGWPVV